MPALPYDLTVFLILFARIGAILMLLPVFSETTVPVQVRLLLALGFTAGLFGMLGEHVPVALRAERALPGVVISEMLVGFAIGGIINILFKAAAMAGSIVSVEIGLSSVLVNDPSMGGQVPLTARVISVAATLVCLAMGVHHLWIESMVHSYTMFPVGGLPPAPDFAQLAIRTLGQSMQLAVGMAAPLIVYGLVFNTSLGLAARMAPMIQVFFISQPLHIMLGVALFAMTLGTALTTFATAMGSFIQSGWKV